jgi:hypothetical protein
MMTKNFKKFIPAILQSCFFTLTLFVLLFFAVSTNEHLLNLYMKVRINWLIIIYLLLLNPGLISAQEGEPKGFRRGFIIKYPGDTIKGLMVKPYRNEITKNVYFRLRKDNSNSYSPYELAGFGAFSPGRVFMSVEVPTTNGPELSFIRILIESEYDLLYYTSDKEKHFLIRDPVGKITDLAAAVIVNTEDLPDKTYLENSFNLNLKKAFEDIPELVSKSEQVKPEKKSLTRFMENYYNKNGINFLNYSGYGKASLLGIVIGTSFDRFIPVSSETDLNTFSIPYPYAGINLVRTNINTGFGIFIESMAGFKSYHYYYSYLINADEIYNESFIKSLFSTTRAGLTFESVSQTVIKPFIEGGAVISYLIDPQYENYTDVISEGGSIGYSYHNNDPLYPEFYYGAFLRTGLYLKILKKEPLKISLGYDYLISKDVAKIKSFDLALTYKLKIK